MPMNRLPHRLWFVRPANGLVDVDDNLFRRMVAKLLQARDDVFFGIGVEIPFIEWTRVERVEQLRHFPQVKLDNTHRHRSALPGLVDGRRSCYSWSMRRALRVELDKAAKVFATYGSAFSNITTARYSVSSHFPGTVIGASAPVALPQSRVEFYYSPDKKMRWQNRLSVLLDSSNELELEARLLELQPRHQYTMRWNEPPFAPASTPEAVVAIRLGDRMLFSVAMFGDRSGHVGTIDGATANYELYANGQKVAEQADFLLFDAPADRTEYTLVARAAQPFFSLSPSVTTEWQFASEHAADVASGELPFLTLQLQPLLSSRGAAYRGLPFAIPITVRRLAVQSPSSVQVRELSVEASFDDGKSWHRVAAASKETQWVALLKHPKQADFVSLR